MDISIKGGQGQTQVTVGTMIMIMVMMMMMMMRMMMMMMVFIPPSLLQIPEFIIFIYCRYSYFGLTNRITESHVHYLYRIQC